MLVLVRLKDCSSSTELQLTFESGGKEGRVFAQKIFVSSEDFLVAQV
jgi:hypothetical protein